MKRKLWPLLLALVLLAGCGEQAGTETVPGESFVPHAVDEERLREEYAAEGYDVVKLTPYRGDYVAELAYSPDSGSYSTFHMVDWVYGRTGRRIRLETIDGGGGTAYEVTGVGQVVFSTCFFRVDALYKTLPRRWEMTVLWDEEGEPYNLEWSGVRRQELPGGWLDPREPYYTGAWDLEKGEPREVGGRYEQLYDARVTVDGLTFSFIPQTGSGERFGSFFPAATGAPYWETDFDGETGRFTLRLRQVSLSCGPLGPEEEERCGEEYRGLYPYAFPEGSLGRDSHFLTGVEVHAEGEDTVVTGILTGRAGSFTVEQGNLGEDTIPKLRVVFREQGPEAGEW